MRIHCDACGAEIEKEDAIAYESDDGEVFYFCSDACFESRDYHETMHDPGPDDDASAPDVR